jgi:hypothetical protein
MLEEDMDTAHIKNNRCHNGGKVRSATAKRHPAYGIFLPDVMLWDNLFPSTYNHGVAGGKARMIKATRDNKGRFIK